MCNPQEDDGDLDFDADDYKGFGLTLVEGGGGSWTPGNFGYLQTGLGPGANVLEYALGANVPPGDCLATDGVTTKPGENTSVTDAINTRFDICENGLTNSCTSGTCSPSPNVRKDVVRSGQFDQLLVLRPVTVPGIWCRRPTSILPDPTTGAESSPWPKSMGHPRISVIRGTTIRTTLNVAASGWETATGIATFSSGSITKLCSVVRPRQTPTGRISHR